MKRLTDMEYLKLNRFKKIIYSLAVFFCNIPYKFSELFKKIGLFFKNFGLKIKNEFVDIYNTFKYGDWKTRTSFFIMGFGSIARGQIFRGILFLLFQIIFILYMILYGGHYIGKLDNLGDTGAYLGTVLVKDPFTGKMIETEKMIPGDNSFKILLYGILSLIFVIALIYTWRVNVKQNKIAQDIIKSGKKLKSGKDDLRSLVDDQFHKTLLALPLLGIVVFTVLPIIFMILIAFTNYDATHTPPQNLFTWVGLDNFNLLFTWSNGSSAFAATFGEILAWTIMWAFFATFTNYFLGMFVAMMINKKGIRFKKLWRTILVLTIAVPQFISLLYVSKMFSTSGIINGLLRDLHIIDQPIDFWGNKNISRVLVIVINLWVGIPYLMLIATGILMNIPQDLYESAKIDGANAIQQYTKITLPYMLFITGPYLLTSFISNMNNFNVIYLLTGGAPSTGEMSQFNGGYTDLLVTWLFKLTVDNSNYKLAAVIGIMVFVVVAVISLIIYNVLPSTKNEEDYQ